jgi:hypothetical protein
MITIFSSKLFVSRLNIKITVVIVAVLTIVFIISIHPFLALNKTTKSDILIVEGWLPESFLKSALTEFNTGGYKLMLTIGGPTQYDSSRHTILTSAQQAVDKINSLGFDNEFLVAVPYFKKTNHRTLTSFLALRNWLSNSNLNVSTLNVFTVGVHGRKSYILCKKVMGENIKIGVISAPPARYNPKYWWLSKRGIRLVIKNTIGYFYALFVTSR